MLTGKTNLSDMKFKVYIEKNINSVENQRLFFISHINMRTEI